MIIKEMFHIPMKLKPELARNSAKRNEIERNETIQNEIKPILTKQFLGEIQDKN
jgi:hypothetical protein